MWKKRFRAMRQCPVSRASLITCARCAMQKGGAELMTRMRKARGGKTQMTELMNDLCRLAAVPEGADSQSIGQNSTFQPHHINIMKVALALVIIRQKPEGVSSKEYTERLALQFSQLQVDWRERALQLQQELLRTRQELTTLQLQAETKNQTHNTEGVHWSDSEWQSSGYSSSFQPASQEREQQPPSSVLNKSDGSTKGSSAERIVAHVKFLSSVSTVLSARQKLSVLTESDLRTTVRDTILQATRGLTEALSAACLPPSLDSLQTAIQMIVEVAQAPRMRLFHAELVDACNHLLKAITRRISSHQDTNIQSDALCSVVCTLCSVPVLYCHAVQYLVSAVLDCAKMLYSSTQDVSLLDIGAVESISVVFRAIETLFTKYDTSTLPQQTCSRLSSELENSVLELSTTYPLFTFSVWRVLAHLSIINRT